MSPLTRSMCVFLFFLQFLGKNALLAGGASHWYLNERLGLIQRVTDVSPPHVYGKFHPRRKNDDEEMASDDEDYGGVDAAIDLLETSLSSEDQAPELWNNLGLAYRANGQLERSLECFERARAVLLHPDGCVNVGTTHFLLGNLNDAEHAFREGLHLEPHHPLLHFCLAGVQQAVGGKDEAMRHYEEALALQPEFAAAQLHLVELRRGKGEWGLRSSWWIVLGVFALLCFVAQQSVQWCVMGGQLQAKPHSHQRPQLNPLPPHPISPGRKKKRSTG